MVAIHGFFLVPPAANTGTFGVSNTLHLLPTVECRTVPISSDRLRLAETTWLREAVFEGAGINCCFQRIYLCSLA